MDHYKELVESMKPVWDLFAKEQEYNSQNGLVEQSGKLQKIIDDLSDYIVSHP